MDEQKCLELLREIKDVTFATVDEHGKPQARIIDVMLVENTQIYFCTARGKEFYRQIIGDGNVAIVGMNHNWQMVRLEGKAFRLDEQKKWIDKIFEQNPTMNHVYPEDTRYILEAFRVNTRNIEFFDLGTIPIVRKNFSVEDNEPKLHGYFISDGCVGCGKCENKCPQKCIKKGMPYEIIQENCLHCGLCYEVCPVHSIIRRKENDE